MKLTKISLGLGFLFFLAFTAVNADCPQACDKFIVCTEEVNKTKANAQQKALLTKGCSESCKKHQEKILECYETSNKDGGSCTAYSACIMKFAQLMKKSGK